MIGLAFDRVSLSAAGFCLALIRADPFHMAGYCGYLVQCLDEGVVSLREGNSPSGRERVSLPERERVRETLSGERERK